MRRRAENNDEKRIWCDDDAMKKPEWNKAVAGASVSCNFIFASPHSLTLSGSLSLSLSHSPSLFLSLYHYYQVNEGWRWMHWMHGLMGWKKREKTYERTNIVTLQFFFKYTIMKVNVIEMSKIYMWIYMYT
jgi:hypothetical protein